MSDQQHLFEVDNLLSNLFATTTLKELFEQRVKELNISPTNARNLIQIERLALNGILDCTQKNINFDNLLKLASFLQLPVEKVVQLYVAQLQKQTTKKKPTIAPEKIKFIKENFDLVVLRKSGFIKNITDFEEIEKKLVSFFGIKTIFEYTRPKFDVAFSTSAVLPKTETSRLSLELTRGCWIQSAKYYFEEINNPYEYDRERLLEYFPEIGWHSTNVEIGLFNVIKTLFRLGVTVIYQSPFANSLHVRGATFPVNEKPCIVLTNYRGFYATIWHALIHELFHVLFDWEDIKQTRYHLSVMTDGYSEVENTPMTTDRIEDLSVIERDKEADDFARAYLFSREKSSEIQPYLKFKSKVEEYAKSHQIHPSFIYAYNAYEKKHSSAWALAKQNNPKKFVRFIEMMENPWENAKPIIEHVKYLKGILYN
ncbi:MAG: hypothetical protein ACO1PI_14655 [Bacteroidota bacterium]